MARQPEFKTWNNEQLLEAYAQTIAQIWQRAKTPKALAKLEEQYKQEILLRMAQQSVSVPSWY